MIVRLGDLTGRSNLHANGLRAGILSGMRSRARGASGVIMMSQSCSDSGRIRWCIRKNVKLAYFNLYCL